MNPVYFGTHVNLRIDTGSPFITLLKGKIMAQIVTSVSRIHEGDVIAAYVGEGENFRQVSRPAKVEKLSFCPGKPENVHLGHHCYDMRITTFMRVES
jgi:hypothetical protein